MVVFDSTMLLLFFRPGVRVPPDAAGKPVTHVSERIDALVDELEKARTQIIIPTPVLSEVLIRAGTTASEEIVSQVIRQAVFRIEAFDTRAAIENAAMGRADLALPKAKRDAAATYAKLKFDRQVLAIARVNGATTIYSDDRDLRTLAVRAGMTVVGVADLPLPATMHQTELFTGPKLVAETGADPAKTRPKPGAPSMLMPKQSTYERARGTTRHPAAAFGRRRATVGATARVARGTCGVTAQRNQVAKLRRLYLDGALTLPMLREIEIMHDRGCPARDPRTMNCTCDPAIWWRFVLISPRLRLVECVTKTA